MATFIGNGIDSKTQEKFSPTSKFIEVVEYDANKNEMDLTFRSGTKIRYLVVYPSTFLSFKKSPSHDAFYSHALRGNFMSMKLIDANIGRKESTPMHKVKKEHHLDAGLRKDQSRNERIHGTVSRAFATAALSAA